MGFSKSTACSNRFKIYTFTILILFEITDSYQAPPRYMTDTKNSAYNEFPDYLKLLHTALTILIPNLAIQRTMIVEIKDGLCGAILWK